jgi:hypothetical protein
MHPGKQIIVKKTLCLFAGLFLLLFTSIGQRAKGDKKNANAEKYPAVNVDVSKQLRVFNDSLRASTHRIILCADVPNNKRPLQVAYHQESGHVFLILQKILTTGDTVNSVFGFYPKRGLPTLFFKTISSRIKDNSFREYDVEISMNLSKEQFDTVLSRTIGQSVRKYHINKYNCYDYALAIFNSVAGDSALPSVYVRFPFIFGRGGSPCSVYKDLTRLKNSGSSWAAQIRFGAFRAPVSSLRILNQE